MIRTILWDVDGTLLDFLAAEKHGMTVCLSELGIAVTERMLSDYSAINLSWWEKLERGEVTQKEVLVGRYIELFDKYGLPHADFDRLNVRYQFELGQCAFPMDDSLALLEQLGKDYAQYLVTNGTRSAQEAKLSKSGIDRLVDGVFISETVGYQKPKKEFFDAVQKATGYLPEETVIVGDSLTSDMRGGNNACLRCCWYNPKGKERKDGIRVDHEIRNLWELPGLLKAID